ncbi:DUF4159 domain-containing protein [Sinomicrobium sp.]
MNKLVVLFLFLTSSLVAAQEIAVLQYGGGGDWYANPTALPNLIRFSNEQLNTHIEEKPATVAVGSIDIFQYPLLHMTGHGHVFFSEKEAENLRTYLLSGGFLHVDDNYGLKPYIEKEMQKVFPDKTWIEIPPDHPIFNQKFHFPDGLPKIHEHDNKRPQAFGYFHEDRLVFLFSFESDLGDGWEDPEVHHDPEEVRQKALQMGANIIQYVFEN